MLFSKNYFMRQCLLLILLLFVGELDGQSSLKDGASISYNTNIKIPFEAHSELFIESGYSTHLICSQLDPFHKLPKEWNESIELALKRSSGNIVNEQLSVLQYRSLNYYASIGSETCEALKTALYNLIDGHTSVSYGSLWTHYQSTDDHLNDAGTDVIVWDMYSDNPSGMENEFTFVSEQCGNYQGEGDCYNREHTFPKSWWGGSSSPPQYTDLFTVVPTDGWVNGLRNNYPYGEVINGMQTHISNNGSLLGPTAINIPGYSGSVFEPIDDYKGDLARGYFYMATRYQNVIDSWENNTNESDAVLNGDSYTVFEPWMIDMMINWHTNDPVDQKELDRNDAIFAIQGNRNPFIDHPEYVAAIWSGCDGTGIDSCIYVYTTADNGLGSLRSAVDCATNNDTITFSPDVYDATIELTSDSIEISNNITIAALSTNNITISSLFSQVPVFKINSGAEVSLIGFKIEGTNSSEGAAIDNSGSLILDEMVLIRGTNTSVNSILLNEGGGVIVFRGQTSID